MSIVTSIRLFADARSGWAELRQRKASTAHTLVTHTLPLALLPALCGYWGTTQTGWEIGASGVVKLTNMSAGWIALGYFLAVLVAAIAVAWTIRWMGATYGARQPFSRCLTLASYAATPLFLVGLVHLTPIIWLNLVVGIPALAITVNLFYRGVPEMMEVEADRAFLFSTAVVAFGLVTLVGVMAATVLLWSFGFAPEFTHA